MLYSASIFYKIKNPDMQILTLLKLSKILKSHINLVCINLLDFNVNYLKLI